MSTLMLIFNDPDLDAKAKLQQSRQYIKVIRARSKRLSEAKAAYMQGFDRPLLPLEKLQQNANSLQQLVTDNIDSNLGVVEYAQSELQRVSDIISSGNYAKPDTPEMEYHDQFFARLNAFPSVWPDEAELAIRQQEADEILTLLT